MPKLKLRVARVPPLLEIAISYILFLAYFTVSSFEHALLEAAKQLSRLGLGRVLIRVIAAFGVDRKYAIQEALRRLDMQPLVIAYLDEQAGIDRKETIRTVEESIIALLRRASRNVETFVSICEMVLMLMLMALVVPQLGTFIGAGMLTYATYAIVIGSVSIVYLLELAGYTLSRITCFPRRVWLCLGLGYLVGLYTYFLTLHIMPQYRAAAVAGIVTGLVALVLTGRDYATHVRTIRSFPTRVRLSFNSLFTGNSLYYPPKVDNVLDSACELIYSTVKSTGSSETISVTYRLIDGLVATIQHMRNTLLMIGIAFLGVLIGTTVALDWMLGNTYKLFNILGVASPGTVTTQFTLPSQDTVKTLLTLALLAGSFVTGKLIDNELLGTYLLAIAGTIAALL